MHDIMFKLNVFLDAVQAGNAAMPRELADEFGKLAGDMLVRQYSPRETGFTIRLSAVGRPLCQQVHEQAGTPKLPEAASFPTKMLLGDLSELIVVALLKAAGVEVTGYQERVSLPVPGGEVSGTLDVTIRADGENAVWDVKSCSKFAFENKFTSYEALAGADDFGYVPQLFGYAKARGLPAGGWIALCKETGEIAVLAVPPEARDAEERRALATINANVKELRQAAPCAARLDDVPEMFRKAPTGNRKLGRTCEWCGFKLACWPDAQHRPSLASAAKNPAWTWYTSIHKKYA